MKSKKTGKREAGEETKQATDFKEARMLPFCGRLGGSTAKKWFV